MKFTFSPETCWLEGALLHRSRSQTKSQIWKETGAQPTNAERGSGSNRERRTRKQEHRMHKWFKAENRLWKYLSATVGYNTAFVYIINFQCTAELVPKTRLTFHWFMGLYMCVQPCLNILCGYCLPLGHLTLHLQQELLHNGWDMDF